ncbi:MAG: putative bacilysin exporter BacE [Firmicutes bacterium]|nr:putative bacilysin exporter BacE [Bacillota bacterium]
MKGMFSENNKSIFMNRNFMLLWFGKGVSQVGNWIHYLAILTYVGQVTGSMTQVGFVLAFSVLPVVIFAPIAGGYADIWNRKKIIVYTDFISGVVALYLGVRILMGNVLLGEVYLVSAIMGICKAFFNPALSACIPTIVRDEELNRANSLIRFTTSLTEMLGPLCGGLLLTLLGVPVSFIINGVSFILSGISESFAIIPQRSRIERKKISIWADIVEGCKFVIGSRVLSSIIGIFGAMVFFVVPIVMMFKVLSEQYYGMGTLGVSLLIASGGLGALLANGYLVAKPMFKNQDSFLLGFPIFSGITLVIIGNVHIFYIAVIMMFIQGVVSGLGEISMITLLQRSTPDEKRGKVFGLFAMMTSALAPISLVVAGPAIKWLGVPFLMTISGAALIVGGIALITKLTKGDGMRTDREEVLKTS